MGTLIARIELRGRREGRSRSRQGRGPARRPPAAPAEAASAEKPALRRLTEAATIDITIPDIGDFKDIPVIEVLVKVGDTVEAEQPIVTLESDKASMDVPSPAAGKITRIVVKVGDKVSMGSLVGKLDAGGSAGRALRLTRPTRRMRRKKRTPPKRPTLRLLRRAICRPGRRRRVGPALADFSGVFAGPAVRRLARELGLDLNQFKGTGEKGRITREDLKAALAKGAAAPAAGGGALPAVPHVDFAKFGPIETVPLSRIKKISGPRLHASWVNIPHVTHRTKRTSPSSTPSERRSTRTRRKTNQSLTASRCCRFSCGRGRVAEGVPDF